MPRQGSVEVGPPAAKGEGRARRCYLSPDKLLENPSPEVTVLAHVVESSIAKYGGENALGWRDTVRMISEEKEVKKTIGGKEVIEKKTWLYFELSDYKYWTYAEFGSTIKQAAGGLIATGHSKKSVFNIYSATSAKWQVMANACAQQGITFATAYDSLGEEGLEHSINQPEVYGMFTNANLLSTIAAVIKKTPSLKVVVYDGAAADVKKGSIEAIKAANGGVQVITFDDFLALGKKNPVAPNYPRPSDIACIMYTSGSTGAPKGVLISNANIVAAVAGVKLMLSDVIKPGESYIAYLPLAHIMEFVVELCMFFVGVPMGYGTVKTLTDTSVRNCVGDIRAFRPTIMVGVPAVWELIRKGILTKVKAGGALKSSIFHGAFAAKRAVGGKGFLSGITDAVVFNTVKQATGGRLRFALSGGAPISRETQEFLTIALVTVLQGYGMTESCAMCAILTPDFADYGKVGVPVPSCEIKLLDVEEANYFSTNTPPQGEVLIRGPSVSDGYYKQPDVTAETITADGWLKTGDIGQWNPDGTLSVIDRKKNLVKLAGGEYIALERLESVYKSCDYVSNICLYADSQANKAMAIIFPHELNMKAMVAEQKLAVGNHDDMAFVCKDSAVIDAVLKELNLVGKKAGLKPLESLQTIILTPEEWTPVNGCLTAAMKLQRKTIGDKFKTQIKAIYP